MSRTSAFTVYGPDLEAVNSIRLFPDNSSSETERSEPSGSLMVHVITKEDSM